MRLVVFSYKPCWTSPASPSGYATDGGFPFQMAALSELFDATTLVLPRRRDPMPAGLVPLDGHQLTVRPLAEPPGRGLGRKLAFLGFLPFILAAFWRQLGRADAVHAAVPGDFGAFAIPLALLRRKPLFVRHCGTWGRPVTVADHMLYRGLRRIAGGQNVVLATGGGSEMPEPDHPAIRWIFSTSLSAAELVDLPRSRPWRRDEPPRLISVGRLTRGKNTASSIAALAEIRHEHPQASLDVVGHGPELDSLRTLAAELGVAEAVRFHGNLDHGGVLEQLARAHLLVFPTRVNEGFPKAVIEAMACGVPVVAPRVSVLPSLLADGRGHLLDDTGSAALAAALRHLLGSPETLQAMAEATRQHAEELTLERWRDQIGERLEEAWRSPLRPEEGG